MHLISKIFRRRVIGIHNITYGALFDLIECVVQRCFLYATKDTRYVYRRLSEILQKPEVHKLVVIVHSQGGIILSNVVDMILADCRPEILKKMEVYTFGYVSVSHLFLVSILSLACHADTTLRNAANHFNNPMVANDPLYHIEHFCNEHDFVARIGTIAGINEAQEDVKYYVGKVVLYLQRSGHLMNQHYLHPMFIDGQFGSRSSGLVSDVDESNSRLCEYLPRA